MNRPIRFQPGLVFDNHYPLPVRITLFLCDRLLRAVHRLASSREDISRTSWLQLWRINEALFEFVFQYQHYIFRLGFSIPHIDSPWFDLATRSGPHYSSIPLSQVSLLLPARPDPQDALPRADSRSPFDPRYDW